jgi:hypothetical protein
MDLKTLATLGGLADDMEANTKLDSTERQEILQNFYEISAEILNSIEDVSDFYLLMCHKQLSNIYLGIKLSKYKKGK